MRFLQLRQMANARLGTHNTKRRSEVRGGGAKPWRQKGTGRARRGSMISAQSVGGGRVHTPKPRDYTQAMPQKMRRAAMVDSLSMDKPRSADLAKALSALAGEARKLVLVPDKSDSYTNLIKSGRNLADAKLLQANYLNIRDLFTCEKVIIPLASLDVIKSYLG